MSTTSEVLEYALETAESGWPVFPCQPGRKTPATPHGHRDATLDPAQIHAWFSSRPDLNLAVATGSPGPDVLDIDQRGEAGDGFAALTRLADAGFLNGASGWTRTPSGGLHVYFRGSGQRTGHLAVCHIDFLAQGGYALIPPSHINGRPYEFIGATGAPARLDWQAASRYLQPARQIAAEERRRTPREQTETLARWVARQPEGNRNNGLFWAANRALETDPAADLSRLAAAARQAGLGEPEITSTLNSARRTTQHTAGPRDRQAEGEH